MPRPRTAVRRSGGRLSRSAEFERVYRQGRSHASRYLVLYDFPRPESGGETGDGAGPRLGVSVARRVGGAVERNRVKRLLREAFAVERAAVSADRDIVVVARPDVRELAERRGLAGVQEALRELLDRAGVRPGPAPQAAGGQIAEAQRP